MDVNTDITLNPLNRPTQNLGQISVKTIPTPSGTPTDDDDFEIDVTSTVELSESPDAIYHYFIASPMYAGFGDLVSPERMHFLENLRTASPALKNYLTSSDTVELIFSVGKEYDFRDIQITELGVLVRELLAGNIFLKDFPMTVSSKLGIDDIKAGKIVNELVSKSFGPIIEDVKRIQRSKFPDKVMAIQKEAQPAGLTQPMARREPVEPARPDSPQVASHGEPVESVRPLMSPVTAIPTPSQPKSIKHLDQSNPQIPPPSVRPSTPQPQQTLRPESSRPLFQSNTPGLALKERQFKIPDSGLGLQNSPPPPVNPGNFPQPHSGQSGVSTDRPKEAQRSLEEELAKVANIIDLRAKSGEK